MSRCLPIDFTPFDVDKTDVYARQVFRNLILEQAADDWLKKHEKA